MRKVGLYLSMSLDGYVASDRVHHSAVTIAEEPRSKQWKIERIGVGAHLVGDRSYEPTTCYGPQSTDLYAAPMNRTLFWSGIVSHLHRPQHRPFEEA